MSCGLAGSNTPAGAVPWVRPFGHGPVGGGEAADRMARGLSAGVRLPEPPAAGLARLTGSPAVVARAVTRRAWRA